MEAWFLHMQQELRGASKAAAGQLHMQYLKWLLEGLEPAEALCQRGLLHLHARCYLQVRVADVLLRVVQGRVLSRWLEQPYQAHGAFVCGSCVVGPVWVTRQDSEGLCLPFTGLQ